MELDDAFANAAHIPGAAAYPDRWRASAEAFCNGQQAEMGLAYGPGARQRLDLFLPEGRAKGLMIFVHGGYWLKFGREWWSHLATGALARGWAVALPSYTLAPQAHISEITAEIARAVGFAAARVEGPISLSGHSAGGQLVARMLAPGVLPDEVLGRVAHVAPISPVADLRPLLRTSMNSDLRLSEAEAAAESPVLQPAPETPVTVWVGADERPVFLEQAEALAKAWGCGHVVVPKRHHFDVIDALADPGSELTKSLTLP